MPVIGACIECYSVCREVFTKRRTDIPDRCPYGQIAGYRAGIADVYGEIVRMRGTEQVPVIIGQVARRQGQQPDTAERACLSPRR